MRSTVAFKEHAHALGQHSPEICSSAGEISCRTLFCLSNNPAAESVAVDPFGVHFHPYCTQQFLDSDNVVSEIYSSSWRRLAVLRDPFARFISGYVHFCLRDRKCLDCDDLHCFVEKVFNHFLRRSKGEDFIGSKFDSIVGHFKPQFWYCDFNLHLKEYTFFLIEKSERSKSKLRQLLIDWGFAQELVMMGWGSDRSQPFLDFSTIHYSSVELATKVFELILVNPSIMDAIYRTYSVDYHNFIQLKIPSWVDYHCYKLGISGLKYQVCRDVVKQNAASVEE